MPTGVFNTIGRVISGLISDRPWANCILIHNFALIIAGASTVGIGTALFYDPLLCTKINTGIAEYLSRHGMASINELIGTLRA